MRVHLVDRLEADLSVSADVLERRARELFERESGRKYPAPLVLCGAGPLGRITLAGLRRAGIEPVAIADNKPSLHGTTLDGCSVLSVKNAVDRHGPRAVFVTTIYTAKPLRHQLVTLGANVASSRALFFQHPEVFLPHNSIQWPPGILANAADILAGVSLWSDEESRDEYVAQIQWQLLLRTEMPAWTPPEQTYFPTDLITLSDHESFVDCGAFDGDTLRDILKRTLGQFTDILLLEPDPQNYAALAHFISSLPDDIRARIEAQQVAVHSHSATLRFESGAGVGSNVSAGGELEVRAEALDNLLDDRKPTFLKMDIEGAEPLALAGARETLSRVAPTLAICVYHRREHLWQVPRAIRQANPGYRLSLCRHSDESWESVCYAIGG